MFDNGRIPRNQRTSRTVVGRFRPRRLQKCRPEVASEFAERVGMVLCDAASAQFPAGIHGTDPSYPLSWMLVIFSVGANESRSVRETKPDFIGHRKPHGYLLILPIDTPFLLSQRKCLAGGPVERHDSKEEIARKPNPLCIRMRLQVDRQAKQV